MEFIFPHKIKYSQSANSQSASSRAAQKVADWEDKLYIIFFFFLFVYLHYSCSEYNKELRRLFLT